MPLLPDAPAMIRLTDATYDNMVNMLTENFVNLLGNFLCHHICLF